MIAKGNLHAHGGRLAVYLTKGKDGERAELVEARGFLSGDLRESFCTIQAIADSQTKCEKPFFHTYVRLPEDESLDRATWLAVADRIEKGLGFDGQPRAVAFHIAPDGEKHLHIAWSRIDTGEMRAIDPGLYKNKLNEICRELELTYGLRQLASDRRPEQQTKAPARSEFEEARRLGVDVEATREIIRTCYDRSDSGPSFVTALAEHAFGLAQGDRRDFVVLDQEGGHHALGKRICGVELAEIRKRFGEEFRQSLPSVDELRQQMRDRQHPAAGEPGSRRTKDELAREVTALWVASDTGKAFVTGVEERGYILTRGDRRDFVLVDDAAKPYSLPRLIEGERTAEIRAKLADIDAAALPSVAEGQAIIEARNAARHDAALPPAGTRNLNETAGEIRLAWTLSESGAGLAAALEDRGIMLAEVTRDEAMASQHAAAFAKEIGNFAVPYREGELVAVNGFGGVTRLTPQITGDSRTEIASYLATVDRSTLMSVTDTREVMREANRAAFIDECAEARPATAVEKLIQDATTSAWNGPAFVAALGADGFILARATAEDLAALPQAYEEYEHAVRDSRALGPSALSITEGELVAVNRFGGIHRLNPHRIDAELCTALVEDCGRDFRDDGEMPSILTARGDALEVRAAQGEHRQGLQAARDESAAQPTQDVGWTPALPVADIVTGAARGAGRALDAIAKPVEAFIERIADIFAPSAPDHSLAPPEPAVDEQKKPEQALHRPLQDAATEEQRREAIARTAQAFRDAMRDDPERDAGYLSPDTPLERTRRR